jgi:hypothetical protein
MADATVGVTVQTGHDKTPGQAADLSLPALLNTASAAFQSMLTPTEGRKFTNTDDQDTTAQYFDQTFVLGTFSAVLKVYVLTVQTDGQAESPVRHRDFAQFAICLRKIFFAC